VAIPSGGSPVTATAARTLTAAVLSPDSVPKDLVAAVLPPAQQAADAASRRRGIDLFLLHDNPIGLQLRSGGETAHVLSFLGTSRERHTLNVELRALVGAGKPGFIMNYSGPITQGRAETAMPAVSRSGGLQFELLTGLPGGGVTDAYGDYLEHWAERLQQRFGARDFAFDDTPLVFALDHGEGPEAFVFCNQRSRLVLGDRKYADVQTVTALGADGRWLGGYTLVGWNAKTPDAATNPRYRLEHDSRFGTLAQFGELP
jgi:hypothetical protein